MAYNASVYNASDIAVLLVQAPRCAPDASALQLARAAPRSRSGSDQRGEQKRHTCQPAKGPLGAVLRLPFRGGGLSFNGPRGGIVIQIGRCAAGERGACLVVSFGSPLRMHFTRLLAAMAT